MNITLQLMSVDDKSLLIQLMELYNYEFSIYSNDDINEYGYYGHDHILFDCNRRLEKQVESISEKTAELVRLGRQLEISQDMQDADRFVDKFREITSYVPPEDIGVVLTRYSKDFQEWWREPRPNINEW